MDNNESGGVYAAEKIIRKRYKKVMANTGTTHKNALDAFNPNQKIGDAIVYVFTVSRQYIVIGCIVAIFV